VLAEGGNALEAMCDGAMIAVVYPHMNNLGGDGFWVVHEPSGKVRALMRRVPPAHVRRSRTIAMSATIDSDARAVAALTVRRRSAGMLALEAAKAQGVACGRDLLAQHQAGARRRRGFPPSRAHHRGCERELKDVPGFAETFLIDGKRPAGARCILRRSPKLSISSPMSG